MTPELHQTIIETLQSMSKVMPIPVFAFVASFLEEVITPIPLSVVMILVGSMAIAVKGYNILYLAWIILIASVGKTLGCYLLYYIADKAEDVLVNKFGKYIGITHKEVESIGKYFKKGWVDDLIIFVLRAIPVMPTAPVSIACGLIGINKKTYIISTFLGTLVKNTFYIYLAFTSAGLLNSIDKADVDIEYKTIIVVIGTVLITGIYILFSKFIKNKKDK